MYPGSLKQNRTFRLSKGTGLRMEKIHRHVLQFVDGTKNFMETGSVLDAVRSWRPRTSAENIERVRQAFSRSPIKSIRTAARELELLPTTVHKVLHKRLRLYAYKVQMLQRLQPNDKPKRKEFADNMLQRISEDKEFLKRICFSDETTFHVSWPPRSPDITLLEFFLWVYVKDIVYQTKVRDITDLKQRISNAIATDGEAMLQRTWQEIEYRLNVLRVTKGAHIEMY